MFQHFNIANKKQGLKWAIEKARETNLVIDGVKLGIERRPKRAGNAKIFLASLNKLKSSLKKKNISDFKEQFLQLRESCNKCHASEKVSFFKVKTPKVRILPF